MRSKLPDYIISEYGYPQCQKSKSTNECSTQFEYERCFAKPQSPQSRLLPLRETLNDYYSRLLLSSRTPAVADSSKDLCYTKKRKNKYNEQIKANNRQNYFTKQIEESHMRQINRNCCVERLSSNARSTTGKTLEQQQQQQNELNTF